MGNSIIKMIFPVLLVGGLHACSPRNITEKYYFQHEPILDKIEESYKALYQQKPFTIEFTDKSFNTVSLQFITDSLTYIYEFGATEPRLADTLQRFEMNADKVMQLIERMRSIRCTWINNFDYYVDEKKNSLIFMSIKPLALKAPFAYQKYYILTYYSLPQDFDSDGLLLDKREQRRLRKINGEIFHRINEKVCYTISGTYR